MKIGENTHPLLKRYLKKRRIFDRFFPHDLLKSQGAISYFLNDEIFETRLYLYNYFALQSGDSLVCAKWSVDIYSSTGKKVGRKFGTLSGNESVVVTLSDMVGIGEFGIVLVKMELVDKDYFIDHPFYAVYYTEYTRKHTEGQGQKLIVHSLGFPTGSFFDYGRENYTSGSFLPQEGTPFFMYSSGTLLRLRHEMAYASGSLLVYNFKGEELELLLPKIKKPLASMKINLDKEYPNFRTHIAGKPFTFKIKGKNILSKSFWYIHGKNIFVGEHF